MNLLVKCCQAATLFEKIRHKQVPKEWKQISIFWENSNWMIHATISA